MASRCEKTTSEERKDSSRRQATRSKALGDCKTRGQRPHENAKEGEKTPREGKRRGRRGEEPRKLEEHVAKRSMTSPNGDEEATRGCFASWGTLLPHLEKRGTLSMAGDRAENSLKRAKSSPNGDEEAGMCPPWPCGDGVPSLTRGNGVKGPPNGDEEAKDTKGTDAKNGP